MSKGIRVSKKHGLNPSINKCLYCGEDKNEIVILGKLPNDEEAPMSAVFNYDPCDKCKEGMRTGISFFATGKDRKPTGKFVVVREESLDSIVPDEEMRENIRECRKCLMSAEDFDKIFGDVLKDMKEEKS